MHGFYEVCNPSSGVLSSISVGREGSRAPVQLLVIALKEGTLGSFVFVFGGRGLGFCHESECYGSRVRWVVEMCLFHGQRDMEVYLCSCFHYDLK